MGFIVYARLYLDRLRRIFQCHQSVMIEEEVIDLTMDEDY